MFLGIVGFLMVIIIVAALIRGKSNPVPLFVIVPVIAALITGFTPDQIFKFITAGVRQDLVHCCTVHFLHCLLLHDGRYGPVRPDGKLAG